MSSNRLVADLHLHSRYARATSRNLNLRSLADAAADKGITLLAAPDFTHPKWRKEMQSDLKPAGKGVYTAHGATFVLVTEIACTWQQGGKGRRVHFMVMAPDFDAVERMGKALSEYQELDSDGRLSVGISAERLCEIAFEADEQSVVFPAHAWTPWYGVYGSKSGFDSLEECFGEYTERVPAVETGLSSDPAMNWGVKDIGKRAIVSFSDAHSPGNIGRELTVLDASPDYASITSALFENRVIETIEFHPEHGKYHFNGHRKCGVRLAPEETPKNGRCPVCGRRLTLGVLQRATELSNGRVEGKLSADGLIRGPGGHPPYRSLVPLRELLSQALGVGVSSQRVVKAYSKLVSELSGELHVLTEAPAAEIARVAGERTAQAVIAVRQGHVKLNPGYDGVYGTVTALPEDDLPLFSKHV